MSLAPIFISMIIQMVDRPNTTPIGEDKKTLTFKVSLLYLFRQDYGFDPPYIHTYIQFIEAPFPGLFSHNILRLTNIQKE